MKFIGLLSIICCAFSIAAAQDADSLFQRKLRDLALKSEIQQSKLLSDIFAMNDSLPFKDKALSNSYDSLMRDSAFMASNAYVPVLIDAALSQIQSARDVKVYERLKSAYRALPGIFEHSDYKFELTGYLIEISLAREDYQFAYDLQNVLSEALFHRSETEFTTTIDSLILLQTMMNREKSELSMIIAKLEEQQKQLKIFAGITTGVCLVIIILLFVRLIRTAKRLQFVSQRANDTSEKEELVMKLEAVKMELNTLKVVARKQVETPLQIVASEAQGSLNLVALNDEIQQGLAKIKMHCETGKSSMSVPTYMSIINDTTRLSSLVHKRMQPTESQQKS